MRGAAEMQIAGNAGWLVKPVGRESSRARYEVPEGRELHSPNFRAMELALFCVVPALPLQGVEMGSRGLSPHRLLSSFGPSRRWRRSALDRKGDFS